MEKPATIDLPTPALLLSLETMHSNLQSMAGYFRRASTSLRPHFKSHQVLSLAARQMEAGAIGVTCARLDHAVALVRHGISNVLIANQIVGESNLRRFVELSGQVPVMVAVDDLQIVGDMARLAGKQAHNLNLVVDLDVGLGRCGVRSAEVALLLAKAILQRGLKFRGLMGYAGSLRVPPGPDKEPAALARLKPLLGAKALIENAGIGVEIVTCGSTGDYSTTAMVPGITEVQAGSYLLMDTSYAAFAPEFQRALSVLTTVISKTSSERIVVDAGLKALGCGTSLPTVKGGLPLRVRALHAEHAILDVIAPAASTNVGDKIEIWIQALDSALPLHQRMYGIKENQVEEQFDIER